MGMGICGGAPSSFLCVARRGADHGRRDYPARRRVETSPSGRVVCLCVILMSFTEQRIQHFGFQPILQCPKTAVLRRAGREVAHGQASKSFRRVCAARRPRRARI